MAQICELSNPSDKITFVVDDVRVAGVAVMLLGNGWYGLTNAKGEDVVPLMFAGTHKQWLIDNQIPDLDAYLTANAAALAAFLDTCAYGSITEREGYDAAIARMTPENAALHRAWWNDRNRSSLNNIGAAAAKLAAQFRRLAARQPVTEPLAQSPPLVFAAQSEVSSC